MAGSEASGSEPTVNAGDAAAVTLKLRNASLYDLLADVVKRQGLCVALITSERTVTYLALKTAIDNCAAMLASRGIRAGLTVNVDFSRPELHLMFLFAANRIGASVSFMTAAEAQTAAPRPDLMLSDAGIPAKRRGEAVLVDTTWFAARDSSRLPTGRPPRDSVTLTYGTSGSTGRRKFLAVSEKNLLTRLPLQSSLTGPDERVLVTMGPRTAVSTEVHLATLLSGGSAVMVPADPRHIPYYVDLFGVTAILSTPLLLGDLIGMRLPRDIYRTVRQVAISGAAAGRETIERIARNICDRVVLSYGSTEMCGTARFAYDADAYLPGMVGAPLPGARIEIVDDDGMPARSGAEGEIRIARDNVLAVRGYLNDVDESAKRFVGEWFYPGDRGWLDDQGRLVVAGRSDDVINAGGNKVALERLEGEIERKVRARCAVFAGAPAANHVRIDVVVEAGREIDVRDLATFVATTFKRIAVDNLYTVAALPLTDTGKIDRVELARNLKERPDAFRKITVSDPSVAPPR